MLKLKEKTLLEVYNGTTSESSLTVVSFKPTILHKNNSYTQGTEYTSHRNYIMSVGMEKGNTPNAGDRKMDI